MRKKSVKVTLIDQSAWYVPESEFSAFNVPETPDAVISNYIRGSRGPLLKVNATPDMSGEFTYINANMIIKVDISYE